MQHGKQGISSVKLLLAGISLLLLENFVFLSGVVATLFVHPLKTLT